MPASRRLPSPSQRTRRHRRLHGAAAIGVGLTLAAAGALGVPGAATAAPTTTPPATTAAPDAADPASSIELAAVPLDSALAEGVRSLKASGADQLALTAAETVKNSLGQISPDQITSLLSSLPLEGLSAATSAREVATTTDPLAILSAAGIQTFTPSIAPFCTAPTADNPLGLVTAGAGAVAGPWPMKTEPTTTINEILALIPGTKPLAPFNLVDAGETGYAFVPASATTGGKIQVAWFNTSTLQGGFADLEPLGGSENATLLKFLPALGAIRLAPVKTGTGTILSAVYGTADNAGQTCYFLPAVGVVNAQ